MHFDEVYDVVVAGYGFAGGAAAIAAADAGARVLLLEKMPIPGGISICAGGGVRTATDADQAFAYLEATNGGATPAALLRHFAEEMTRLPAYFARLAATNGARLVMRERAANYPFPGATAFQFLEVEAIPGFEARRTYPHAYALRSGPALFKLVEDNVRARGIVVRFEAPARRLLTDDTGAMVGLEIGPDNALWRVQARRGVILACGGFEASAAMQRQYWQLHPVLPAATRGNTGDGVRMAQAVGADLWHMWHLHGSYGFRHPDPHYPFGIRTKRLPDWTPDMQEPEVQMAWILLDRTGRRFMNEYPPYLQDTGHRHLEHFDPTSQRFATVPASLLVDEVGRQMYPLGHSVVNDPEIPPYVWSVDNLQEVALGMLKRADSIAELAQVLHVDPHTLTATLERWNTCCRTGQADEYGRPAATRVPLQQPPFYVGEVWPVVSNTQGGPVHDVRQRVLNPFGEVIPRLYVAGELGSIWGYLYLSGGNLSECFITGQIAGREAASNPPL